MLPAASDTEKVITVSPTAYSSRPSLVMINVESSSLLSVAAAASINSAITGSLDAKTLFGISTLMLIESAIVSSGAIGSKLTLTTVVAVA